MKEVDQNRIKFYEFLNRDIDREELENWVYSNKNLESSLPQDHYIDLISYSCKSDELNIYIEKLVKLFFDWEEYEYWRTIKLLKEIVNDKIETVLASRKLRTLYNEQEESIKKPLITIDLGIGLESELDVFPIESEYKNWNQNALKKKLELVKLYKNEIKKKAFNELSHLLNNKSK